LRYDNSNYEGGKDEAVHKLKPKTGAPVPDIGPIGKPEHGDHEACGMKAAQCVDEGEPPSSGRGRDGFMK
jgi:hypothetical protein